MMSSNPACTSVCWIWPSRRTPDVATCNGNYVWENNKKPSRPIFPEDKLASTGVMNGAAWLKKALDSRKFLHVTRLNIYRHDFIRQHGFRFEHRPAPSGYSVDD